MVKRVITDLDSSKASGFVYVSEVDLKSCEPELLCILTDLFNICLKESCFQIFKSLIPVFKNLKTLWLKTTVLLVLFLR